MSVNNIPIRPGDKDTLVIEPDATRLSYTSSRAGVPDPHVGVSDNQADYSFEVAGISDQPGSTLNIGLPPEGDTLTLQTVGSARAASGQPQGDPRDRAGRRGVPAQGHPARRRGRGQGPVRQLGRTHRNHASGHRS